jgi:hypothetical protein
VTERVVDAALDVDPVGGDAALAAVAELGDHRRLDRDVEIGIVEDQQRRVAAQLQRQALDGRADLAISRAPTAVEPVKVIFRTTAGGGDDVAESCRPCADHTLSTPGGIPASSARAARRQSRQRRLAGRLADDRAARRQGRRDLARQHGHREVPRRDRRADADRLALDQQAAGPGMLGGMISPKMLPAASA